MLPVVHPSEGCDDTATVKAGTVEAASGVVTEVVTDVDVISPGTEGDSVEDGGGTVSAVLVVVSIGELVPGSVPTELALLAHAPRQSALAAAMTANRKVRWVLTAAVSRTTSNYPLYRSTKHPPISPPPIEPRQASDIFAGDQSISRGRSSKVNEMVL